LRRSIGYLTRYVQPLYRTLVLIACTLRYKNLQDGRTALHCAALEKHENVVRLLLDKGANVEAVRVSYTSY
jgi:hypothetical protein